MEHNSNDLQPEDKIHVGIWSKPVYDGKWSSEGAHTLKYAKSFLATSFEGEPAIMNGKKYAYFSEGYNPNIGDKYEKGGDIAQENIVLKNDGTWFPIDDEEEKRLEREKEWDKKLTWQERMEYNPEMESGGAIEDNEKSRLLAEHIIKVIGGKSRLKESAKAYDFIVLRKGLRFSLKNKKVNLIDITLDDNGFYTITMYNVKLMATNTVVHYRNVYEDMLLPAIERYAGVDIRDRGGKMMANGGEVSRNQEIAAEIISQIGGQGRLRVMTGAYDFMAVENGVSFKIKNPKANYIKIILEGDDLYKLEIGRIRGLTYKIIYEANGIYADMVVPLIEKYTGLYLSI